MTGNTQLAAYKKRITAVERTGNGGVEEFWDFINGFEGFTTFVSGGAQIANEGGIFFAGPTLSTQLYYPGTVKTYVAAPADKTGIESGWFSLGLTSLTTLETRLAVDVGSGININNYKQKAWFGFGEDIQIWQSLITNGAFFYFDPSISNNWIVKLVGTFGTEQFITSVPVTFSDTYLKILVSPSNSFFYINNIVVYNSLHGGDDLDTANSRFGLYHEKIDGFVVSSIRTDAIHFNQRLLTNRAFS